MTSVHYRWRPVRHPLRLVAERGWRWGRDPRASVCLVSPRGTVYEVRHNRAGTFARKYEAFWQN